MLFVVFVALLSGLRFICCVCIRMTHLGFGDPHLSLALCLSACVYRQNSEMRQGGHGQACTRQPSAAAQAPLSIYLFLNGQGPLPVTITSQQKTSLAFANKGAMKGPPSITCGSAPAWTLLCLSSVAQFSSWDVTLLAMTDIMSSEYSCFVY